MHRLLAKQIEAARGPDGRLDVDRLVDLVDAAYVEADRDRRRTDRSIGLMIEEVETLNRDLEAQVEARTTELEKVRRLLQATFDSIPQGVLMVDADGRARVWNRRAPRFLGVSPELLATHPFHAELVAQREALGQSRDLSGPFEAWLAAGEAAEEHVQEWHGADGVVLDIRSVPLAGGGFVRTYADVTDQRAREAAIVRAERDYRGLFENSVVGIYRSTIDGRQLRANPALVKLNGYASEEEMLPAVRDIAAEWYVEPGKREEFKRLMREHGRVTDFVAEIYRHKTRERIWVSETAWTIYDENGEPKCFEGTVVDATERVVAARRIEYLAHHDALTGLANREVFQQRLARLLSKSREGRGVAVLCIDLDRFKAVNDTLGHQAGDALLREAAQRLEDNVRPGDLVARLGGDEFAVIQTRVRDAEDALALANRLRARLAEPFVIAGQSVSIAGSVGIAVSPGHGVETDVLHHHADLALYRAKKEAPGSAVLFEEVLSVQALRRRAIEAELRAAIEADGLDLAYQPIFDPAAGRPVSYEALLRWNNPTRGPVPPSEFVPIAEEAGLISRIGAWVLTRACEAAWALGEDVGVSVNVSPAQFADRSIVPAVVRALAESGLPARRLTLEITESLLLRDIEDTKARIGQLRALGVRVALDDFGVGYSALGYLSSFEIDVVKIDRSFVASIARDATQAAIVKAIFDLCRALDIEVVAEGIEDCEQAARLSELGCERFQGYFFGRPRPLAETVEPSLALAS